MHFTQSQSGNNYVHALNGMQGDTMACIYYQLACCRSCLKAEVPEQCLGLSGYQLVSLSEIILNNILSSLRSTYLCVCYNFDIFLWHIGYLTIWTISNVNKNRIVWHFTPMLERKVDTIYVCQFSQLQQNIALA